jgi:hypothetical protein
LRPCSRRAACWVSWHGRAWRPLAGPAVLLGLGGLALARCGFLALGRDLLLAGPLCEETFSGATLATCSATVAVFSVVVASAFVLEVTSESFLRQLRRTTIHPGLAREGKAKAQVSVRNLGKRGERLARAILRGDLRTGFSIQSQFGLICLPRRGNFQMATDMAHQQDLFSEQAFCQVFPVRGGNTKRNSLSAIGVPNRRQQLLESLECAIDPTAHSQAQAERGNVKFSRSRLTPRR